MTYWFIFCKTDLLLEKQEDGTYTIPCYRGESDRAQALDPRLSTSLRWRDGTEVKTFTIPDPVTDNPNYEMCGLAPQLLQTYPRDLYHKAGKCHELNYWDQNTQFCGICGAPMKMSTDISKKCTECGKSVWPSLATAIIVLIRKGEEVLLVHARNFKSDFYGLVAGFVETGETLEQAVHREVMEETGLDHQPPEVFRFSALAISQRADGRLHRRLCRWRNPSAERRTLTRQVVYQVQSAHHSRKTLHCPTDYRCLARRTKGLNLIINNE